MARPLKGETPRKNVMIRLDESEKELLIKHFGGVQAAVDNLIGNLRQQKILEKALKKK